VSAVPARLGWVWQDPPPATFPPGLGGVLVRAANGAGVTGSGTDYARLYAAWSHRFGARVLPWTWVGPPASSNGAACAEAAHRGAFGAPLYVADVEGSLPATEARAFAARLRQLEPGCLVGFSSYPTRAQATSHGVPWDALVETCDIGFPQVYYPAQRAQLGQVIADHRGRPVHVAVSPANDAGWAEAAARGLAGLAGASVWRYGLPRFDTWARALASLTGTELSMAEAQAILDAIRDLRGDPGERAPDLADILGKVEAAYNKANEAQAAANAAREDVAKLVAGLPLTSEQVDLLAKLVADRLVIAGLPDLTGTATTTVELHTATTGGV